MNPRIEYLINQVVQLYIKDVGSPVRHWWDHGRFFIDAGDSELMLRFDDYHRTLVIARVAFRHQRRGNGAALLGLLKAIALELQYQVIEIESAMTDEIQAFAVKHGFRKRVVGSFDFFPNYILTHPFR